MENKIKSIKEKLSNIDTEELLDLISLHFTTFAGEDGSIQDELPFQMKSELMSPQKQYFYLAGLLMSTNKQSVGKASGDLLESLEKDIQDITGDYIKGFISNEELFKEENRDRLKKHLISMDAFISYFDTGLLRYNEQTEELIKVLYAPFDNELKELCGLTTSDYLDFFAFVNEKMTNARENMQNACNEFQDFLNSFNHEEMDSEKMEQEYSRLLNFGNDHPEVVSRMQEGFTGNNKLKKQDIINRYGEEKADKLLELFALERKDRDFQYYNGKNPFVSHPLCWLDQETLYLVSPQILLNAIYDNITETLEKPSNSFYQRYCKTKADIVEIEFLKCFKEIFHEEAKYHMSVCESIGTQEHDILVEYKNYILVAEVKASKVREPFFNPEKAYKRIKDHFFSDSGIGYAYKQACLLRTKIQSSQNVELYEDMRNSFKIDNTQDKIIIPIVLTLNQFGGLAINTSLLLQPEEGAPYPWVCNLHDFQNLIEIVNYLKKSPEEFIEYVEWRSRKHKDILAGDELDIVEQYFTIPSIRETEEPLFVPNKINGSLIDKIYFEKLGLHFEEPISKFGDIDLNKISTKIGGNGRKIYPNEPCPCGSGRKFKKCHKGKGIYD